MILAPGQAGPLISLVAVTVTVAVVAVSGRRREHKNLDLAMAMGLLAWMVFLVWQPRFSPQPPGPVDEFIEHMAYQLCVASACELALGGADMGKRLAGWAWSLQILGGGSVLLAWTWTGDDSLFELWEVSNWVIVGSLLAVLLARWPAYRRDQAVRVALLSFAMLLYCLVANIWHHPKSGPATAGMFIYPAGLIGLWFLVTAHLRARAFAASRGQGELQRQRIAQDVHDGIGSQLVSIISSLDLKNPEQQALAMSLEQCLLDLKITVDSISQDSPSLLEGLGMLRYRIQPSLDRLGVALDWDIEDHPAMARLPSLSVTHSLRIVQEAVANVMRHAEAAHLTVSCRYLPHFGQVELKVVDDGRGMTPSAPAGTRQGRGLKGMRRRAEEAGLQLAINSVPGRGTTVGLRIPAEGAAAAVADRSLSY